MKTESYSSIILTKRFSIKVSSLIILLISLLFVGCKKQAGDILSTEERQWLNQYGGELIHAPDPYSPPMEFFDTDSIYKGITADYLKIISERLNINIKTIKLKDWSDVVDKAKKREIDFSTAVQRTVPRQDFWNFTTPYFDAPNVIIVRNDNANHYKPKDLYGKKVAIVKDYAASEYVQKKHSDINFVVVSTVSDAIKLVSFSDVEAAVLHLTTAAYYTKYHGFTHLKVAGDIGYTYNFTFASRNNAPILNQILEKGLNSISEKEKQEIHDRWISLQIVPFWKTRTFWLSTVAVILLFSLLIWFIVFLRHKNLALEIATDQAQSANRAKSEFLAKYESRDSYTHECDTWLYRDTYRYE